MDIDVSVYNINNNTATSVLNIYEIATFGVLS